MLVKCLNHPINIHLVPQNGYVSQELLLDGILPKWISCNLNPFLPSLNSKPLDMIYFPRSQSSKRRFLKLGPSCNMVCSKERYSYLEYLITMKEMMLWLQEAGRLYSMGLVLPRASRNSTNSSILESVSNNEFWNYEIAIPYFGLRGLDCLLLRRNVQPLESLLKPKPVNVV